MSQKGFGVIFYIIGIAVAIYIGVVLSWYLGFLGGKCQTIDEIVPMYGGVQKCWPQQWSDQVFIFNATNAKPMIESSRLRASRKLLLESESYRDKGDFATSMKLLNKSWLLSPNDPLVFSDFGALLGKQNQFDVSFEMFEKGLKIESATPEEKAGVMCNYGLAHMQKLAIDNKGKDTKDVRDLHTYTDKANQLFEQAIKLDPNNGYCHGLWVFTLVVQEKYNEAWHEVKMAQKLGYEGIPKPLLEELTKKMPDPGN